MDSGLLGQAVQYHGPELVRCLQIEQQQMPSSMTEHLSRYRQRQHVTTGLRGDISQRIQSFVAKKADYLFTHVEDASVEPPVSTDEDTYAKMPPIESFMGVDWTAARRHFFNSLERYDIVIGVVTSSLESGLVLTLLCLDNDKARDIDEMKLTAFCPAKELPRVPYQSPMEAFTVKDKVRGVVVNVNSESERIIVSLNERALSEEQEHIKLGLINADEFPVQYRRKLHIRGLTFDELLHSILGFNNVGNVPYLLGVLKLEDSSSYMRGLHKLKLPEKEMAEGLRKQQSQKWAHQSVAEGIKYFKMGKQTEAMQYLNKALQIDALNVEALTARGALYANNESYTKAMEDFEEALKINPNHQNAKKYMYETLLAVARMKEDIDNFEEAEIYIKRALDIEPQSVEAREALRFLLYKKDRQHFSDRHRKQGRYDEGRDSDEEMFMDRTTATLKKLINEDRSRSDKKRKERSPRSSRTRRSRSPRSPDKDIFGRRKYDGIPGLDFGQETEKSEKSPPRQKYRSRSPEESPSRQYNVDHQSSFMFKARDNDRDGGEYPDYRGKFDEKLRGLRESSLSRDRQSVEGRTDRRSMERNSDRKYMDRNPDGDLEKYPDRSRNINPYPEGFNRNPDRSIERNEGRGSQDLEIPKEKSQREEIDLLYGDIDDFDPNRQEEERVKKGLTENLMKIKSKSSEPLQLSIKKEDAPGSLTQKRSVSPNSENFNSVRLKEEKILLRDVMKKENFTDDDKSRSESVSPVKKKKSKKMKNKEDKTEKKKRKSKGSLSPSEKRFYKDGKDTFKREKSERKLSDSYSRIPRKDMEETEEDRKSKGEKKYKKRKEYPSDVDSERKRHEKIGSIEDVVKSRWDSPTDEKYYKDLNPVRKSRFDSGDKYQEQKPKLETVSKFRNTFKETTERREDLSKVKEEAKVPQKHKSTSREREELYPQGEPKKFGLPSKEDLDREFEGIRIHIRNDKYNSVEEQKGSHGPVGVRPFDSVEEDPVSIVSVLHSEQIYAPKPEPAYQEELFEVKLKRDDSPTQHERPKSNYRTRRSQSSSSSSRSRSSSYEKSKQRRAPVSHDKRRSHGSRSRSPSSHHGGSERKRSRSPHSNDEKADKSDIGKKIYEINRYNKNRILSDGKSVTIKPFVKLEIGSRGRGGVRGRGDSKFMDSSRGRGKFFDSSRGRGKFIDRGRGKFVDRGRGKFIDRGQGKFRGRGQYHERYKSRGDYHKDRSYSSKRRSRSRSSSRSRSRSKDRSRHRSRDRSRSRSKHRSRSPKNSHPKSRSPQRKKESWSPPIGQGSGYYGPKASKPGKADDVGVGTSVPMTTGAPSAEGKSSLDMMETFLEELRQKKMQAAANNNF
ncbi:tetratricopeptide repeat protein 14-like [Saccostrea echinata]|uniref:tetratricopeptide repeat protein 14-like n=1 Tax=Saccostrea echinata TaxID=191078 RepID=UPI002A7EAA0D|nr:tetratricopeptide repeat protein 14-like [Saccostrea echinata]XP_061185515.1 tetratricopeptide repeat protein 14-like [Saccostrea echinata]